MLKSKICNFTSEKGWTYKIIPLLNINFITELRRRFFEGFDGIDSLASPTPQGNILPIETKCLREAFQKKKLDIL